MSTSFPAILDAAHRRCFVGGEPMLFHCHHYNTFLQRSIQDAYYIESRPFLIGGAAEVAHAQLLSLFRELHLESAAERMAVASELYRWAGFGTFDLSSLGPDGGSVATTSSHYAMAWRAKWHGASSPVCLFASGWLAGAAAAVFGLPNGSFNVSHETCRASSESPTCIFELARAAANYPVFAPVGAGPLTEHRPRSIDTAPVDYEGIFGALTGMEIVGDANGVIPAFGVFLTRHYANYYNRISFEFLRSAIAQFGDAGREVVEPLLIEAGHVCAFNTFGGIMTSSEWDALIRPNLTTREHWVHGMTAAANALGWGRWQVREVSTRGAEFILHDDYESIGHLGMYGRAQNNVSYLAEGGAIGLMNLVYYGDIASKPTLDETFYDRLFKGEGGYCAKVERSQAMGDDVTVIHVRHV
ncbi:MAG: hypothetical protein HYV63_23515 [Candidatus Schekmanbacteria bacterium]|nr:hypothetical protein [Candidatus Schekmanbacteria bacterium]